jgi:hypothetical protein
MAHSFPLTKPQIKRAKQLDTKTICSSNSCRQESKKQQQEVTSSSVATETTKGRLSSYT